MPSNSPLPGIAGRRDESQLTTVNSVVGVLEIGGSHVTSALVDTEQKTVLEQTVRHRTLEPTAPAELLLKIISEAITEAEVDDSTSWAVAIPGPFDYADGIARYRDVGKFDTLNGVNLRTALAPAARFAPMGFVNDADAFAVGEWACGAVAKSPRCMAVTLGSGIGSAFLDHGRPVNIGPSVPPEGRLHLVTVGGLPLEDHVSRRAIRARYQARNPVDNVLIDVEEIVSRARAGEPAATEVLNEAFGLLGEVVGQWVRAFVAERVVFGGAMTGGWDVIAPSLRQGLLAAGVHDVPLANSPDSRTTALVGAALALVEQRS